MNWKNIAKVAFLGAVVFSIAGILFGPLFSYKDSTIDGPGPDCSGCGQYSAEVIVPVMVIDTYNESEDLIDAPVKAAYIFRNYTAWRKCVEDRDNQCFIGEYAILHGEACGEVVEWPIKFNEYNKYRIMVNQSMC